MIAYSPTASPAARVGRPEIIAAAVSPLTRPWGANVSSGSGSPATFRWLGMRIVSAALVTVSVPGAKVVNT